MQNPWRTASMVLVSSALFAAGCGPSAQQPSQTPPRSETPAQEQTTVKKEALVGEVLLRCVHEQDGSEPLEVVRTATGYEAAVTRTVSDPYDCRCDYEVRDVLGQYTGCQQSGTDPRIMGCWRIEPGGTTGKVVLSATRITRTQLPIGGGNEVSYSFLEVAAINQDPGHVARRDFVYNMDECEVP